MKTIEIKLILFRILTDLLPYIVKDIPPHTHTRHTSTHEHTQVAVVVVVMVVVAVVVVL